jgi:hypothetical protein
MPVIVSGGSYSSTGYVAPTVFLLKGGSVPGWRYYSSLTQAAAAYIDPDPVTAAGSVYFMANDQPQTFGINVDFYVLVNGKWTFVDYSYMKDHPTADGIIRMFTPQGDGAFYAVLNRKFFGLSATVVSNYEPAKIAALDTFYREVALLKYRYNALVGFLNSMANRTLTPAEQQIYNSGLLRLQILSNQLNTIDGLDVQYSAAGAVIGVLPIILIIAIIAILAGAASWTITTIQAETEKTKRINDSFELLQFVADQKRQVAEKVAAGSLTQAQANEIYKTLDSAAAAGTKVAETSSQGGKSFFEDLTSLVKWGLLGYGLYIGYNLIKKRPANA